MNDTPNPPAFPAPDFARSSTHEGMTLRDYFAAKAMELSFKYCTTNTTAAEYAYQIADAMLKARTA